MSEPTREQFPCGTIERDLCKLAAERSVEAMHSVMQLSDDPRVKLEIAISAMGQLIGAASGIYAGVFGLDMSGGMKKDFALAVIDMVFEARAERNKDGVSNA